MEEMRQKILASALEMMEDCPHWASLDLKKLAQKTGFLAGELDLAFPKAVLGIVILHLKMDDLELAQSAFIANESIREKIAHLIWQRLNFDDRQLVSKTASFFSQPLNFTSGAKALFDTSDAIWRAAGDKSTDFSYYTRRASLAAIYSQAVLFYISPQGKRDEKVQNFIKQEIDLLLKIMGANRRKKAS